MSVLVAVHDDGTVHCEDGKFRCGVCGGEFDKLWTDADAIADFRRQHPGTEPDTDEWVCGVCHEKGN